MSLIYCFAGVLVAPNLWLPSEPFDYGGWHQIGCNQLRCGACKQAVQSSVDGAKGCRHYACACQSRDEYYGSSVIGSEPDWYQGAFQTAWYCAGHPRLELPTLLDGITIPAVGSFEQIVDQTLANPPFIAPGFKSLSFWVQRLYRLLPEARQALLGQAVALRLSNTDARVARAAMDFFAAFPHVVGAEQVAIVAGRDHERLRATPDPTMTETPVSIYDSMLETLEARLMIVQNGVVVDRTALETARRALIAGEAGTGMIFVVASCDPVWFCDYAADIVRAKSDEVDFVLEALKDNKPITSPNPAMPIASLIRALQEIRSIDKPCRNAVLNWLRELPREERAKLGKILRS